MRRLMIGLIAAAGTAGLLASPASAVVTASNVTSPAEGIVTDPDNGDPNPVNITVSGTATGNDGDIVDIYCVFDDGSGNVPASFVQQSTTVTGGAFSRQVDLHVFPFFSCRLIATPDGLSPPYDLNTFSGPVIHNSGFELSHVSGGPNDGDLYTYEQTSSALAGYWDAFSAGDCFVRSSKAMDPVSLRSEGQLFGCSRILQDQSSPYLRFGGQNLVLPYEETDFNPGFTGITALKHSVDPVTGEMRVSDSETPVHCVAAGMNPCASYAPAGLRLDQEQTGGTDGRTLRVTHRWLNTTREAKELRVEYRIENQGFGWRSPGESAYVAHSPGDTVPPGSGPGSLFLALASGSSCPNLSDACGSFTWYRAPDSITFTDSEAALLYTPTIPAHGSRVLAFDYSHGYPQASVDGYAAAARSGFNTSFTVGKPKRNRKRGTARLPVNIPGAGKVAVSGKGIKPAIRSAGASASATAHSAATTVLVKPKKKVRRKLNRRGRARVTVSVTYTRTGLDPVTKKVKLTLRKNLRRGS